jgi:hypothetical protein
MRACSSAILQMKVSPAGLSAREEIPITAERLLPRQPPIPAVGSNAAFLAAWQRQVQL